MLQVMEQYKVRTTNGQYSDTETVKGHGWKITDDALLIYKYEDDEAADHNIRTMVRIYNNRYWISFE